MQASDPGLHQDPIGCILGRKIGGVLSMFSHRLAAVLLMSIPAAAQWLNYPTPGVPRTADGKPNLSAPVPRTADGRPEISSLGRKRNRSDAWTNWERTTPAYIACRRVREFHSAKDSKLFRRQG